MSLMDNVKQLDTKQKIMLIALIGCVGLVLYLVYSTFFATEDGGNTAATPDVPPAIVSESTPPEPAVTQPAPTVATTNTTPQENPVQIGQPSPATPESLALLAQSQQMQQQYIELVNQYQLAQLQQKLAQVDAQIAASKLTTTKSLVELKKLQPELGQAGYEFGLQPANTKANESEIVSQTIQTMYVGQVSGRWQAMLQINGQYFQVSTGMTLPDGSTVTEISNKGVVVTAEDGTPVFLPISKNLD